MQSAEKQSVVTVKYPGLTISPHPMTDAIVELYLKLEGLELYDLY